MINNMRVFLIYRFESIFHIKTFWLCFYKSIKKKSAKIRSPETKGRTGEAIRVIRGQKKQSHFYHGEHGEHGGILEVAKGGS